MEERKTVLITGTSTGIGHAACELFAERGWTVYAGSRLPERLSFSHHAIRPIQIDVNDPSSIVSCFEELKKQGVSLDCVVNNAGFGVVLPFENMPREEIEEIFRVNVFGLMEVSRHACALMREQGKGTIINISSVVGQVSYPFYAAYAATKWAVEGFSEALAHEMRPFGVIVKLIEPGRIRTDFHKRAYDEKEAQYVTEPWRKMYEGKREGHAKSFSVPGRTLPAEEVARVIVRAATDRRRKLRYRVGNDTNVLLFLKKILPKQLYFELLHRKFM